MACTRTSLEVKNVTDVGEVKRIEDSLAVMEDRDRKFTLLNVRAL